MVRPYDRPMARVTRWSDYRAARARAGGRARTRTPAVEVLFTDGQGTSYVVYTANPSPSAAVVAAEEEARLRLGCESATDWRAA